MDEASAKNFKEKINDGYRVNMILDNLPVAVVVYSSVQDEENESMIYVPGITIGGSSFYRNGSDGPHIIYNHMRFKVAYHEDPEADYASIVSFEVEPYSINHEYKEWDDDKTKLARCTPSSKEFTGLANGPQLIDTDKEVIFTYDVSFVPSDIKWSSRWDAYLYRDPIHWFSILRSLMTVLVLSGVVAIRVMRTLSGILPANPSK